MSAFVDTSAIYALMVRSEARHGDVLRSFRELLEADRPLATTSYVVVEATALLQSRIGLAAVRDLVAEVLPVMRVAWVDEDLHERGVRRLLREDRRGLSLVDCVSLEFMRTDGIHAALALDPQLGEAGAKLLPAPATGPAARR